MPTNGYIRLSRAAQMLDISRQALNDLLRRKILKRTVLNETKWLKRADVLQLKKVRDKKKAERLKRNGVAA